MPKNTPESQTGNVSLIKWKSTTLFSKKKEVSKAELLPRCVCNVCNFIMWETEADKM